MQPDQRRIDSIFLAAAEKATAAERAAYLDVACASDPELRERVERLLAAQSRVSRFLETPAPALIGTLAEPSVTEPPGTVVGPYRLLEQIGEGGMGTVWMAEQTEPIQRRVAVKVVKEGMDTREVLARFEAERQALALMEHPNIARILDAGKTPSGRPYFVMELVEGQPITRYCDGIRLGVRERLELFGDVCRAVQHAHQKGIIHRDLKPSNVLVAPYDGKPVVKVIDFGVAKATGQRLTDKLLFTGFGALVGTPEYMSPEQAEVNNQDIDTRSDVYSLGVLLYELLTGTTPLGRKRLKQAALLEVLRLIREEEPPRPSVRLSTTDDRPSVAANRGLEPKRLSGVVRGELDWIAMRALEKDRGRRYQSAGGLAADVQRYLADEPVEACPPSAAYRLGKFARRNKGRLAAAALVLFVLASLGGVAAWTARERADRRQEAALGQVARRAATEAEVGRDLEEARALCREERLREASALVDHAQAVAARGEAGDDLGRRVAQARADVDMAVRLEAIRLERAAVADGSFDFAGADARYRDAFRGYGIDVTALDAGAAAARVRASPIRELLLAALDDWVVVQVLLGGRGAVPRPLLAVLQQADADPWRGRLRDALGRGDQRALKGLSRNPKAAAQPPATLVLLGAVLGGAGERALAAEMLRSAQRRHPGDFWVNHNLAWALERSKPARPAEAVRYYQAALALRPDSPGVRLNLGNALRAQGDLPGAAAECRKALELRPGNAYGHNNLGVALRAQGDLAGAVAEYRKAVKLRPDYAEAHNNLGAALANLGDLAGAVAAFRKAIDLRPDYAEAHTGLGINLRARGDLPGAVAAYRKAIDLRPDYANAHTCLGVALHAQGNLAGAAAAHRQAIALEPDNAVAHDNLGNVLAEQGNLAGAVAAHRKALDLRPGYARAHNNLAVALAAQGDVDGAVAEYRKALALEPGHPLTHCSLGGVLLRAGDFQAALAEARRGHELGSKRPRWKFPSAAWVRECERFLALDARLPGILARNATPADAGGRIQLAKLCSYKRLNGAAAHFYEAAFAAAPELADAPGGGHRYNAARAGALAGCGRGQDADRLDDRERARLRRQALDWLRADLAALGRRLGGGADRGRPAAGVLRALQRWHADPGLAGVRGEAVLGLPGAERPPWRKLWGDAAALLRRAEEKSSAEKK
jgi:serine/threonine protein kinase/Flp pilus assembly protein TadD